METNNVFATTNENIREAVDAVLYGDIETITSLASKSRCKIEKVQDMTSWDTRQVTNMNNVFADFPNHVPYDINQWDVSNVVTMNSMFYNCTDFNQDLSRWKVDNVTDMANMFMFCEHFNQDIGKWNVSNVTDMRYMFYGCKSFDQDIGQWNMIKVENMEYMLEDCVALKLPYIRTWKDQVKMTMLRALLCYFFLRIVSTVY